MAAPEVVILKSFCAAFDNKVGICARGNQVGIKIGGILILMV